MIVLGMTIEDVARVLIVPILFIIFNAFVEIGFSVSKGWEQEGRSIRVLYRDRRQRLQELYTEPSVLLRFHEIHTDARQIIRVESLNSLNLLDYPSIPINLVMAALTADSLAFFSEGVKEIIDIYTWMFPAHLFSLISVVVLSNIAARMESVNQRRRIGSILFFLGFLSAFIGFIALRSLL